MSITKTAGKRVPVPLARESPNTRTAADVLLRMLRDSDRRWAIDENHLLPAYVVSVCAAIEHRLNEAYISHFHRLLGYNYQPYANPYLRLRIEEKLGLLIPLISNFAHELNRKDKRVIFLFKVFRLRNRLVHQVPHFVEGEFEELGGGYARFHFPQGEYRHAHSHPEWASVQRRDLVQIHAALNFWMPWLFDIATRIRHKRFNHRGLLTPVTRK